MSADDFPYKARARLADNLLVHRNRRGIDHRTLARLALIGPKTVEALEGGEVLPLLDTYIRIAGSLAVDLEALLEGVSWQPPDYETLGAAHFVVAD